MEKTNLRVALYCRVASADQLGLEHQDAILQVYADERGYSDHVSYLDNGYSGLDFDRPAFSRLNADIQNGKIDAVLVRDVSRIGRNYLEVVSWIDEVEKKGVVFITADHPWDTEYVPDIRQALAAHMRSQ